MNTTLTVETPVGQIAAEHPLATRVFARHRIDYCCGGGRPLAEVCRAKNLEPQQVLDEIGREISPAGGNMDRWTDSPLPDLIDHILTAYHMPLHEELPRLEAMADKVVRVHGDKDPERLGELLALFRGLKAELDSHLMKEEAILFPMIRRGLGAGAKGPVAVMLREHDDAGGALLRLRELTDDYTVPDGACNTWRALWAGLAALETALHEHIHLENNILFPRALAA
jgi:regulator of cell morphogenesis and NO signaling